MPIPRHLQLDRLMLDLIHRARAGDPFHDSLDRAASDLAEALAAGDAASGFKSICDDLEDMAAEGFLITPELYKQIQETGRSLNAPEKQWTILARYVTRT